MEILIANDDGIHAPGLRALALALQDLGRLTIIAPEREQSAVGHAVTLHKPLRKRPVALDGVEAEAYATNGTPADCVALGTVDPTRLPGLVVAGINVGANLGEEVLYSGTASAAMEGALAGVASFAISVTGKPVADFTAAAQFARALALSLRDDPLPPGMYLNVNVPNLPPEQIQRVEATRLGWRRYVNRMEERVDPRGQPYYWFSGDPEEHDDSEGTDIAAVAAGRISVTPLHFDLTSHTHLGLTAGLVANLWPSRP